MTKRDKAHIAAFYAKGCGCAVCVAYQRAYQRTQVLKKGRK